MNDNPRKTKPHLQQQIGGSWLLWFKHSNRYAVLEPELKKAVDGFLDAEDARDFRSKIKDSKANHELLYSEIEAFLTVSSTPSGTDLEEKTALPFDATACPIATDYRIRGVSIRVHYQNEDIKALTHNGIAHYAVEDAGKGPQSQFWLYIKEEVLHLFQDQRLIQAVQKDQVHYIQGKFNYHLISLINKMEESEWAATLHASTVVYNGNAVLLAGQSGKGKSTLT
ncbi:hypothetical protein, partial [Phaeodactylibacter xiamenensis]|uniref:hypothetical protein n=1 Tax=Phaeodactylibacter xiamenensis TaxID=1524460 RepID=UPI0024A83225